MDELLKLKGYDFAILGVGDVWMTTGEKVERIIYSGDEILRHLMIEGDMDIDEAIEFISFNIEGAYVGPRTPIVVWEVPDFLTEGEEE